jgi:hypothetical protein
VRRIVVVGVDHVRFDFGHSIPRRVFDPDQKNYRFALVKYLESVTYDFTTWLKYCK